MPASSCRPIRGDAATRCCGRALALPRCCAWRATPAPNGCWPPMHERCARSISARTPSSPTSIRPRRSPSCANLLVAESGDQARGVPAVAAHLLHVGIVGVDEGRYLHLGAVALGLIEDDAEVLAHPVDGKAEVELALVHGLPAVVHLPGLGRALGDGLHHLGNVEAGFLREG